MKITVDIANLFACVEEMGAPLVKGNVINKPGESKGLDRPVWKPIKEEIKLEDSVNTQGVLSHIDEYGVAQQVLLYIQDHGNYIDSALQDISHRRKFHVADCTTLQKKRADGTFERYVMTNELNNQFFITGMDWNTKQKMEGTVELQVCKNCLKTLNYKNYSHNFKVFNEFSIADFFTTYSSFFASLPTRLAGEFDGDYTDDWQDISREYRVSQNYTCESCEVDLSKHQELLHTHHINGVKTDNKSSNLQALCVDCHRKQVNHDHLFVHHEDMVTINQLRREQLLLNINDWSEVFEFADSAVHGFLGKCQQGRASKPVIAYELLGDSDQIIAQLELAWPKSKQCIVISENDKEVAQKQGWTVWTTIEALENFPNFKDQAY